MPLPELSMASDKFKLPVGNGPHPFCAILTEKYEKLAKIGQGTFGEVYRGRRRNCQGQQLVAMKRILIDKQTEGFPITALREIKFLQRLDHRNIVRLLEICHTQAASHNRFKSSFYLIFEYCDYDLAGLLNSVRVKFSLPDKKNILSQLLNGLYFIHSLNVIHRDIKSANILLTREGVLKLADFGLSRYDSKNRRHTNRVVTLWYRPPELLLGSRDYGSEIDMWGVGCIMAEMWTRKPLLPGGTELQQLTNITNLCGSLTEEVWPGVTKLQVYNTLEKPAILQPRQLREKLLPEVKDKHAVDLIDRLMCLDPTERINCDDALSHDFFWLEPEPSKSLLPLLVHLPPVHELDVVARRAQHPNGQQQSQHHAARRHHPYAAHQPRRGAAQLATDQLHDRLF